MGAEVSTQDGQWMGWHGGLFFRRADDGTVQIGKGPNLDAVVAVYDIDPDSWSTIVASVSRTGAHYETVNAALRFHRGD